MIVEKNNIELRSEKVRNIIGQIPPSIIRIGITIVFIIFSVVFVGAYYFKYNYIIDTTAFIDFNNETTFIQVVIPANEINKIKLGQKVILNLDNIQNLYNKRIELEIEEVPIILKISHNNGYFTSHIIINNDLKTTDGETVEIFDKLEIKASIITDDINVYYYVLNPIKDILRVSQ
jgi:hypothetical protein